jgi:hypothetical protein
MSLHFISNTVLAAAGAFVVAASLAFAATTTGWIAVGIGLAVLAGVGLVQMSQARGVVQRALDAATGVLAIWTVVASVAFTGATLRGLSFAEAVVFVGIAIVGLAAHDRSQERLVRAMSSAGDGPNELTEPRTQHYSAAA